MQGPSHPHELTSQCQKLEATIYVGAMVVRDFQASLNDWDSKVGDGGLCILKWLIFLSLFDLSTKCILIKCHKCIVNHQFDKNI
jgi:hypothetical protein